MKIVSSQTDEDLAKASAAFEVEHAARQLAANMLRVVRGAGKAYELLPAMQSCLDAAHAFYALHQRWPIDEVQYAVRPDDRHVSTDLPDYVFHQHYATDEIIAGALQIVASRLLGQRPQEAAGEAQMLRGVDRLQQAREDARKVTDIAIRYEQALAPRGRKKK